MIKEEQYGFIQGQLAEEIYNLYSKKAKSIANVDDYKPYGTKVTCGGNPINIHDDYRGKRIRNLISDPVNGKYNCNLSGTLDEKIGLDYGKDGTPVLCCSGIYANVLLNDVLREYCNENGYSFRMINPSDFKTIFRESSKGLEGLSVDNAVVIRSLDFNPGNYWKNKDTYSQLYHELINECKLIPKVNSPIVVPVSSLHLGFNPSETSLKFCNSGGLYLSLHNGFDFMRSIIEAPEIGWMNKEDRVYRFGNYIFPNRFDNFNEKGMPEKRVMTAVHDLSINQSPLSVLSYSVGEPNYKADMIRPIHMNCKDYDLGFGKAKFVRPMIAFPSDYDSCLLGKKNILTGKKIN